jgi:hypothetical protein
MLSMIIQRRILQSLAMLIVAACGSISLAQNPVIWNVPNGDWAVGGNWDTEDVPDTNFDEQAIVSNGGTATVSSVVGIDPGEVVLGQLAGQSGTLNIANGGTLAVTFTAGNLTNAAVNVGQDGTGHLMVQPGGSLSARSMSVAGETGSSVVLGGTSAGTASVSTEFGSTFGRNLRVIGPSVDFSTQSLVLQAQNTFTAQITGATHSALKSTNPASLDGILRLEFGPGVNPVLGNSWNLIDAPSFAGQFLTVDASSAPVLPSGQVYQFNAVTNGSSVNGMFGRVSVEQLLILNVNRDTKVVSINTGPAPVSIDGYSIRSPLGGLDPSKWNSLQDQAVSDWRESPQGGAATQLSELKPTNATAITAGAPRVLGDIFKYPNAQVFGTELEDISFEYYATDGSVVQGLVNYTGNKRFNNLVLLVDPISGAARLENESNLAVDIDGYKITSVSGSLLPANGNWNSLDDQNAAGGDWRESSPTSSQLAELKPSGEANLTSGIFFNMGSLFKTTAAGGTQDLTFEYLFPEDDEFSQGVVVYRSLTLAGDYNGNGIVDAADYVVWRNNNGTQAEYNTWRMNFGNTLGSGSGTVVTSSTNVPEPASGMLVIVAASLLFVRSRWFRLLVRVADLTQ